MCLLDNRPNQHLEKHFYVEFIIKEKIFLLTQAHINMELIRELKDCMEGLSNMMLYQYRDKLSQEIFLDIFI